MSIFLKLFINRNICWVHLYLFSTALFLVFVILYLGLPYKFVRDKPLKTHTVEMSNSCGQSSVEIEVERTKLLRKLMNITETVHRMRHQLIKTKMELYRRKSIILYRINCRIISRSPIDFSSIKIHKDFVRIS